jgi:hypothetical protein
VRDHNKRVAIAAPFVGFSARTQRQAANVGAAVLQLKRAGAETRVTNDVSSTIYNTTHASARSASREAWTSLTSTNYEEKAPRDHRLVMERVHNYSDGSTRGIKRYVTMLRGAYSGMSLERTVLTRSVPGQRAIDGHTVIREQLIYPDGHRKTVDGATAAYAQHTIHAVP